MKSFERGVNTSSYIKNTPNQVQKLKKYGGLQIPLNKLSPGNHSAYT